MPTKVTRYDRPSLEIEFDQQALTAPGCCRFVPVVVRLCGIQEHQHAIFTVMFERTREKDETALDDYEVHPSSFFLVHTGVPGYRQYEVVLLARGHSKETGQIRIKMESQSSSVLSEAIFCLDARQAQPVASTLLKGSFKALRLLPRIRPAQERDALNGQYPSSADIREMPPRTPGAGPEESSAAISTLPLFSQEEEALTGGHLVS